MTLKILEIHNLLDFLFSFTLRNSNFLLRGLLLIYDYIILLVSNNFCSAILQFIIEGKSVENTNRNTHYPSTNS